MKDIKNRFETFLNSKNLTQAEFSRITGYHPKNISGFLRGTVKMPKIDLVVVLATHFPELDLRWLLLGEGEMINSKTIEIDKNSIQTILEQQGKIFEYMKK
jgi:transcriptional regulator with XRE-family HTH domain